MMFDLRPRLDSAGRRKSSDPGSRGVKPSAGVICVTSFQPFCRALAFFMRRRAVRASSLIGALLAFRGDALLCSQR